MKKIWQIKPRWPWQRRQDDKGQSLVETALFLPILIVLLLGIVEISSLLINQNRVTTAGRIAAGYGAANFNNAEWDGDDGIANAMGIVARNTVSYTLNLNPDVWDIWSVHAVLNEDGDGFAEFDAVHVYGNELIASQTHWNTTLEAQVRQNLLTQLQSSSNIDSDGLEIVVSIPFHSSATFLNLPVWQWVGAKNINGLTAMRVDRPAPYAGCAILPITVRLNQFSAYPSNWNSLEPYSADQGSNIPLFPADGDFDRRNPALPGWVNPRYENRPGVLAPNLDTDTFQRNVPGIHFSNAQPGYIYVAREATSSGGFGWVRWGAGGSQQDLQDSLLYNPPPPGNFMDEYPGGPADMGQLPTPTLSGDGNGALETGEWVQVSTGEINAVSNDIFDDYIVHGRPVTLLYYENVHEDGGGGNVYIQVEGFVTVKMLGFKFTGQNSNRWLLFEFVRWSTECLDADNFQ